MEAIKIGNVLVPYIACREDVHHWQESRIDGTLAAFYAPYQRSVWTVSFAAKPKKGSHLRVSLSVYADTLTACLAELLEECDLRGLAIEIDAIGVDAAAIADAVWTEDVVRAVDAAERVAAA